MHIRGKHIGGMSNFLYEFDVRNPSEFVNRYAPRHLRTEGKSEHITGCAYNWNGKEVIATYNDDLIYRFEPAEDAINDFEGLPPLCSVSGLVSTVVVVVIIVMVMATTRIHPYSALLMGMAADFLFFILL